MYENANVVTLVVIDGENADSWTREGGSIHGKG